MIACFYCKRNHGKDVEAKFFLESPEPMCKKCQGGSDERVDGRKRRSLTETALAERAKHLETFVAYAKSELRCVICRERSTKGKPLICTPCSRHRQVYGRARTLVRYWMNRRTKKAMTMAACYLAQHKIRPEELMY